MLLRSICYVAIYCIHSDNLRIIKLALVENMNEFLTITYIFGQVELLISLLDLGYESRRVSPQYYSLKLLDVIASRRLLAFEEFNWMIFIDSYLYVGEIVQASGSSLTSKNISSSPGELRIRFRRVDLPSPASPMAAITSFLSSAINHCFEA